MNQVLTEAVPRLAPGISGDRFSGHESFACRYGWLPKFYDLLVRQPDQVRQDEHVMITLGIGRNMVKSVRFWAQAFGLFDDSPRSPPAPTEFARWLLDRDHGADPYLEDVGSLWLLHWRLASTARLAAWEVAFFEIPERETLRRFLIQKVERRAAEFEKRLTSNTVRQHVDIFLSCYATPLFPSAQRAEETLACPLQELGLIRINPAGDRDELIEFARGPWRHLSNETFLYILLDYWQLRAIDDRTLTMRSLLTDFASPGLTLRLDEESLWRLLVETHRAHSDILEVTDGVERRAVVLKCASVAAAKATLGYV
jgi:hypothetical protein